MFTASLNLEALKKATEGPERVCAAEGCEKPVAPAGEASAQYCADHSKGKAKRARKAKKAPAR
jgi:hypothetical protein